MEYLLKISHNSNWLLSHHSRREQKLHQAPMVLQQQCQWWVHRLANEGDSNSTSPAVAIYGLWRTAQEGKKEFRTDAREFEERNFYVGDRFKSQPSEEASELLKKSRNAFHCHRLNKIVSNSDRAMKDFPSDHHTVSVKWVKLGTDLSLAQQCLWLLWGVIQDTFTFQLVTSRSWNRVFCLLYTASMILWVSKHPLLFRIRDF